MDIKDGYHRSLIYFIIVSAIPSILIGLLLLGIFYVNFSIRDSWIVYLMVSFLVVFVLVFVINMFLPIANNRAMAIKVALPTVLIFIYVIVIRPFFTSISPSNWLEDIGFQIIWACIFGPPIEFLLLIGVAYFGWLGTRMKKMIFHREQSY